MTSPGALGGQAACVNAQASVPGSVALCTWADNDTFGLVASPTMDAAKLAVQMRGDPAESRAHRHQVDPLAQHQPAGSPACGGRTRRERGLRSENRTIAIVSAAAATARPTISPPSMRVLNGNVAAASAELHAAAVRQDRRVGAGARPGTGRHLREQAAQRVRAGCSALPGQRGRGRRGAGQRGQNPHWQQRAHACCIRDGGSVVAEGDGEGDGLAATVKDRVRRGRGGSAGALGGGGEGQLPAAASVFGTVTVAWSSS